MKITFKTDYAIKSLIDIGIYQKFGVVSIKDISEREDIPLKFLEQIINTLKKEGLLLSKRGQGGGYRLALSPSEITIGRILRIIEGTLRPISCIDPVKGKDLPSEEKTVCDFSAICSMKNLWNKVYVAISDVLDNATLEDLIKETKRLKNENVVYHI